MNRVIHGDCLEVLASLPPDSCDVLVTSPPYWGQRTSDGVGVEESPAEYLDALAARFAEARRVLKPRGIMWVNVGDAYNTPVNWTSRDYVYSSLGKDGGGLPRENSAYTKPRHKRRACVAKGDNWLRYGNLLALPQRLTARLVDDGWLYRGEVVWVKANPLPEGRCRRPHRAHEPVLLFARREDHEFRVSPPVRSVWQIAPEPSGRVRHFSRFPRELPRRCIESFGRIGKDVIIIDPFSGSAETGRAAYELGCSYVGIEIDSTLAKETDTLIRSLYDVGGVSGGSDRVREV